MSGAETVGRDDLNVALLRAAVEWVEEQAKLPEQQREWAQGAYILHGPCGTAYCVAGWIGATQRPDLYANVQTAEIDGEAVHVSEFAARMLRIRPLHAVRLFEGGNTAADIRRIAEDIAGRRL